MVYVAMCVKIFDFFGAVWYYKSILKGGGKMPTDLRVIKTKRVIRGALIELMSEKGISDITVSELSERAMINRKTFYRHYREISDVVTELENEILGDFAEILRKNKASVLDVGDVFRDISAQIERDRDFYVKMMKLNPDLFSNGRIKAMLCRALTVSLKNDGAVTDEVTLSAVSEFTVSGVLSLYSMWFDGGCTADLSALTEVLVRMVSEGLRGFVSDEKLSAIRLK